MASPAPPGPRLGGAFQVTSGLVSQPLEIWVPKPFCGLFQVIRDSRAKESSAGLPFSEQEEKYWLSTIVNFLRTPLLGLRHVRCHIPWWHKLSAMF